MTSLRIGTYNVRGLGEFSKRRKLFYYLHDKEFDLVALQETHSTKKCERRWRTEWGGRIIYSHGESNSKGVAILIKRNAHIKITYQESDKDGRYVILSTMIESKQINFVSLYAPNVDDPEFFKKIISKIITMQGEFVLLGDFNFAMNLNMDKKGGLNTTHSRSVGIVKEFMNQANVVDIWRELNPEDRRYTWHKTNPTMVFVRLDYILLSKTLIPFVSSTKILPSYLTDHALPCLTLKTVKQARGPGFWKLNTELLRDKEYVDPS